MKELCFKTSKSEEEIEEAFRDMDIFECLMQGLKEAVAYSRGEPAPGIMVRVYSLPCDKEE